MISSGHPDIVQFEAIALLHSQAHEKLSRSNPLQQAFGGLRAGE